MLACTGYPCIVFHSLPFLILPSNHLERLHIPLPVSDCDRLPSIAKGKGEPGEAAIIARYATAAHLTYRSCRRDTSKSHVLRCRERYPRDQDHLIWLV